MNAFPQPSALDERREALRTRARAWQRDTLIDDVQRQAIEARSQSEWRRVGLILALVFFVLTLNVLGAIFGLSVLLRLPKGVVTCAIALVAAEGLIRGAKFFETGIEPALWIGGLFAFIFGLPSEGKPEALLVFALAAAIAGWRVLNPIFGGLAFILVGAYIAVKWNAWWPALLFCAVVAIAALVVLARRFERQSTEELFDVLLLVMPLTGYIAAKLSSLGWKSTSRTDMRLVAIMLILAAAFFIVGVMRRERASLLAGGVSLAVAAIEFALGISWSVEAKLMAGGASLVAIGWILSRILHGRTAGFVITPAVTRYDEAVQIAGAIAVASPAHSAAAAQRESGGGTFGGAGASGDF